MSYEEYDEYDEYDYKGGQEASPPRVSAWGPYNILKTHAASMNYWFQRMAFAMFIILSIFLITLVYHCHTKWFDPLGVRFGDNNLSGVNIFSTISMVGAVLSVGFLIYAGRKVGSKAKAGARMMIPIFKHEAGMMTQKAKDKIETLTEPHGGNLRIGNYSLDYNLNKISR